MSSNPGGLVGGRQTINIRCDSSKHGGREVDVIVFVRHENGNHGWWDWLGGLANSGTQQQSGKRIFTCHECGDELQVGAGQWARLAATLDAIAPLGDACSLAFLRKAYGRATAKTN